MLMAAGLGTRLRPFTETCPKPFLPLLGVPMIQFSMDHLNYFGVSHAVVNYHHLPERFQESLNQIDLGGIHVETSDESDLLLGSAGGPRKAIKKLGKGSFLYLNADILTEIDLAALVNEHERLKKEHQVQLTLGLLRKGPRGGKYREIFVDSDGLVTGTGEIVEDRPFFMGAAVLEKSLFKKIPPNISSDFLASILIPAICEHQVGAFWSEGFWSDVGSPELWAQAHFDVIEALEKDLLAPWMKKRIQEVSERVAHQFWSLKTSQALLQEAHGPGFFAGKVPLKSCGPYSVVYDDSLNRPRSISFEQKILDLDPTRG